MVVVGDGDVAAVVGQQLGAELAASRTLVVSGAAVGIRKLPAVAVVRSRLTAF